MTLFFLSNYTSKENWVCKINDSASSLPVDLNDLDSMPMLLIHGGCDSEGEFFNDVFVATIP